MADSKKINPIEKAGISGVASGATIEGLSALMGAEDQSAYWFLKGEMQSRAPLNEMDLEQIMEMLQNVPKKEMDEAIEQAEMMGDEAAMIVLVMADNRRKFREEYASEYVLLGTMESTPADGYNGYMNMMSSARRMVEIGNETGLDQKLGEAYQDESGRWFLPILERKASEEESTEVFKLKSYFSYLKSQKPDLAREIEFSVKNEDELPSQKIYDAGFNPSIIEEWVDYIGVEDDNLQPYESCSTCEGEGWIMTSYTPATRYEPADGDGEDCGECGGTGMIDPADYMDKEGQYYAESFEESCPNCKTNSDYICDSCAQCKGCCETSYGCYDIALCNDCDGDFIGKDIDGCCGSCDDCCECDSFEAETKLSKTSCCCGADEANPCVCMKAPEPMNCSAKAPKCACYKALEKNAEYDEEDMVSCRHCWNVIGNEKEVYGDETVEYEMANGELVCVPCYKEWMEEYKNDLDPHYSPFYAETLEMMGKGINAIVTIDKSPNYIDVLIFDKDGFAFEGRLKGINRKVKPSFANAGLVSFEPIRNGQASAMYVKNGKSFIGYVEKTSSRRFEAEEVNKETRKLLKEMAEELEDYYGFGQWFTSDGKRFDFYNKKDGESVGFSFSLDQWVIDAEIDWDKYNEATTDRYSYIMWEDYVDTSRMEKFVKEMGREHKIDAELSIDEGYDWLKRWQVDCQITINKTKNAETFEARDDSWCVNHGWIRGTTIGDIIPCTSCNDMICGGCRCGGCGNCNTSDCCECSHNQAAESFIKSPYVWGAGIFALTLGLLSRKR